MRDLLKILVEQNEEEDLRKYGIKELKNGLTLEEIKEKFPWILKASIEDAILGKNYQYTLIWYNGIWKDGVWEYGFWEDGVWENGTWKWGVWDGGVWENGVWKGRTWKNGIWKTGTWENGTWENGWWEKGTWKTGTWKSGTWKKGKWIEGYDKNGEYHPKGDSPDKWGNKDLEEKYKYRNRLDEVWKSKYFEGIRLVKGEDYPVEYKMYDKYGGWRSYLLEDILNEYLGVSANNAENQFWGEGLFFNEDGIRIYMGWDEFDIELYSFQEIQKEFWKRIKELKAEVSKYENLEEKWNVDYRTSKKERGKYEGWTIEDLEDEIRKLRGKKPFTKKDREKMSELYFALRAKKGWNKKVKV